MEQQRTLCDAPAPPRSPMPAGPAGGTNPGPGARAALCIATVALLLCAIATSASLPINRFTNYASIITINDVLVDNAVVWFASSGGLFRSAGTAPEGTMTQEPHPFPDLHLTALCRDHQGNLWAGSRQGFLYRIDTRGRFSYIEDYRAAGWDITTITRYHHLLLIGSTRGLSIFDTEGKLPTLNATRFASLGEAGVHDILTVNDTLFLGTTRGITSLYAGGDALRSLNFFDPSIWNAQPTTFTVRALTHTPGTGITPHPSPARIWNNALIHADENRAIYRKDTLALPGDITRIVPQSGAVVWLGTEEHFVYRWEPGSPPRQLRAEGLTFEGIDRVMVSRTDGRVWLLPFPSLAVLRWNPYEEIPQPWFKRITTFDGSQWQRYENPSRLGTGQQSHFRGLFEDLRGNIWFGTYGFHLYHYDRTIDRIAFGAMGRGVVFALAQDSAGYVWASNAFNTEPDSSLMCIKPSSRGLTDAVQTPYFGPGSEYYIRNIYSLNVDRQGTIWAGGREGTVVAFRHDGSAHRGHPSLTHTARKADMGLVHAITVLDDNTTVLGTGSGLYLVNMGSRFFSHITNVPTPVKALAVESRSTLWAASDNGIARVTLPWRELRDQGAFGFPTTMTTDTAELTLLGTAEGLIDPSVTDLSIDRERGVLWIATVAGLSKMDLGHSFTSVTDNKAVRAWPNPFSLSRHETVFFRNIAPHSTLDIYTASGDLVDHATAVEELATEYSWTLRWRPSHRTVPGTYFYRASPLGKAHKLFITP